MKISMEGLEIKKLQTHLDERGFFREMIRKDDCFFEGASFAQCSHSYMYDGVIKAWHYHKKQTDYWYVMSGVLKIGLCDLRKDSSTYNQTLELIAGDMREPVVLKIPPGVAHGCKVLQGPVNLFYFMTHLYDPSDEYRIPYNDPSINFDWLKTEIK